MMIVDELISDDFDLYQVCLTDLCGGPMKGDFCDDDGDDSDYCLDSPYSRRAKLLFLCVETDVYQEG